MKEKQFYDLFDKIQHLENPLKAQALLEHMRDSYGLTHTLYTRINSPFSTHESCHIQGTYPDEWLTHYFASGYLAHDPVPQSGFVATHPFDWADLPKDSKLVQQIFSEAKELGFGDQGLTIPIVGLNGERAIFNITSNANDREWAASRARLTSEFQVLAQFLHNAIANLDPPATLPTSQKLDDTEVECLKWAASGKSIWETSVILTLPERNVRYHLDQARRKLQCNTKVQAVARAVATGLINIS